MYVAMHPRTIDVEYYKDHVSRGFTFEAIDGNPNTLIGTVGLMRVGSIDTVMYVHSDLFTEDCLALCRADMKERANRKKRRAREKAAGTYKSGGQVCKAKFKSFDKKRPYAENDCPICLFQIRSSNQFKSTCGHWYHQKCIIQLMETTDTCAICRTEWL
jgi:hypothetical protein